MSVHADYGAPPDAMAAAMLPHSMTRVTWLLTQKAFSPPAGRKIPFFFTKILHDVQNFCEKEKMSTMLPQANRASIV
jgi:hypothetical protein